MLPGDPQGSPDESFFEDQDIASVNCNFCNKEIPCPKEMLASSEQHICYDCFEKNFSLLNKDKLSESKIHVAIPEDKIDELAPEILTNFFMTKVFDQFWKGHKSEIKGLSSKEIAEHCFSSGAELAIAFIREFYKGSYDKEVKDKIKNENKRP